jgi:hypothetical protein
MRYELAHVVQQVSRSTGDATRRERQHALLVAVGAVALKHAVGSSAAAAAAIIAAFL